MSAIRARNTKPEIAVRRLLHQLGFRFRLHRRDLPGAPDIVLPKHRKVILVHGCFWHMHHCRYGTVTPATRPEFWSTKRQGNVARDRRVMRQLRAAGWQPIVIWECWLRRPAHVATRLLRFLGRNQSGSS